MAIQRGDRSDRQTLGQRRILPTRRGDLVRRPLPVADRDDNEDPAAALQKLYRWALDEAGDAIAWYRRDKVYKRDGSRILRALSIILAAAGGLAPLLSDVLGDGALNWGYVLLAAAAACAAFDHFFGLSTAWMRDISIINAIQRRKVEFELDWAAPRYQGHSASEATEIRFALVGRFCRDLSDLVDGETADWQIEFRSTLDSLRQSSRAPAVSDSEQSSRKIQPTSVQSRLSGRPPDEVAERFLSNGPPGP